MWSPKPWVGYAVAVAATAVAALSRVGYDWWFGHEPVYLIPFLIPVALAGWYSGLRCGLFATALNVCVAAYFFTAPIYSFGIAHPGDAVRVGVFVAVGVGITLLNHQLHRYQRQAEEHVRESLARQAALEREVADRREAEKLLLEHRERLREGASALEAQVAERTREVEGQRRLLDAILDALPAAVIIADPTGRITRMNRACERVWGLAPMSESIDEYGEWVGYWPDTGRRVEPHEWAMSRALLKGEACPGELVEFERFGDRSRRVILNSGAPVYGPDGAVVAGVVASIDVTAQVAAERASRESEQRFRAIFHTQFQFIGLMSPDGVLLEANRTSLVAAGVTEGQVLGRPFWETVWWTHDPAQQDRLREAVRRAAAGQPDQFEASHPRADGTLMWVDFSLTPYTEGGSVTLLIPEGRDITERKRTEAAVRVSEERFRAFMAHAPIAAWVTDADSRLEYVSPGIEALLGLAPGETRGRRSLDLFPPETGRRHVENTRLVLTGGRVREEEEHFVHPDGTPGVAHVVKFPMRGPSGEPLVGGVAIDVTGQRRAEAALRASEEKFRTSFDHAPIGMALVAPDGHWQRVNRRMCQIVGYTEAELLASDFQTITHPDDLDADLEFVRQVLDGVIPHYQMEKRYFHKEGHVIRVLLAVSLVRDHAGAPLHFISQIEDITARKWAEEQVRASLKEKEVLLKEIHHRVKNNLQIVSALLELQAGHADDPAVVAMFSESQGRVLSMAMIHERLYKSADLARVAFTEYVTQLAADLYQTYKVSDDDIRLDLDIAIPPLTIDIAIPCGLLLNELMSNCFKHAYRDAARGCVRVEFRRDADGSNVLAVSDDGPGLPDGFDIHNTPSFGMQLVTTLVDQIDGEIAVNGDCGTTFVVKFPKKHTTS